MPHSTTGTTSYVLVKYSRAYPTKRTTQNTQSGSELASEWQHFTNPTIRLVLDVTRSSKENIESVRLRILWQINYEQDLASNNQPDVVFEDLDLLSFSLDMVSLNARKQTLEGLPLKAVYRDTVVGIRYLHPRDSTAELATHRRFQVSFQSALEASEFIESIKPVCPCKINPTPVPPNINVNPQIMPRPVNAIVGNIVQNTRNTLTRAEQSTSVHPLSVTEVTNRLQPPTQPSTSYLLPSSPPKNTIPDIHSLTNSNPPTQVHAPTPTEVTHGSQPVVRGNQHQESTFGNYIGQEPTNLPASSLPISSDSFYGPTQIPRADVPGRLDGVAHRDPALLATLSDVASIYNMPTSTLERVVGEVIREEGFHRLVERLSEMFTIRQVADV